MQTILCIALLSLSLLSNFVAADSQDDAYALFKQAQDEYEQNDFEAALRFAQRARGLHKYDGSLEINADKVIYRTGNRRANAVFLGREGEHVAYYPNRLIASINKERAEREQRALTRLKQQNPPALALEAALIDEVQDGYLQTEEQLAVRITLKNQGSGQAERIKLKILSTDGLIESLDHVASLPGGETIQITKHVTLPRNYDEDYFDIEIKAWEQDGYKADDLLLKRNVTIWQEPEFKLARVDGPNVLTAGQVADFNFIIQNTMPYPIRNVSFHLEHNGKGVRNVMQEWPESYALIMPNEKLNLSYKVFAEHDITNQALNEIYLKLVPQKNDPDAKTIATKMISVNQGAGRVQYGNIASSPNPPTLPVIAGAYAPKLQQTKRVASNSYALIIGNSQYRNIKQPVRYAGNDAELMASVFRHAVGIPKEQIFERHNMSLAEMQSWLGTPNAQGSLHKMLAARSNHDATVYVYYSGHGAPAVNQGWNAFLTPSDANPDYIEHSGYPLDQLYKSLEALPAKEVIVMLDACFSGEANDGLIFENISPALLKEVRISQNDGLKQVTVLSAASADNMSLWLDQAKHGLFTTYLAKGFAGEAMQDGKLTTGSLFNYINRNVRMAAAQLQRHQTPTFSGHHDAVLLYADN